MPYPYDDEDPNVIHEQPRPTGVVIETANLQQAPDTAPLPSAFEAGRPKLTSQPPVGPALTAPSPEIQALSDAQAFERPEVPEPLIYHHRYSDDRLEAQVQARDQRIAQKEQRTAQKEADRALKAQLAGLKAQGVELEVDPATGAQRPKVDEQGRVLYKPATISEFEDRGNGRYVKRIRDRFGAEHEQDLQPQVDQTTGERFLIGEDGVSRHSLGIDQGYLNRRDASEAGKVLALRRQEGTNLKAQQEAIEKQLEALGQEAAGINVKKEKTTDDQVRLAAITKDRQRLAAETRKLAKDEQAKAGEIAAASEVYLQKRQAAMGQDVTRLAQTNPGAALSVQAGRAPVTTKLPSTDQPPGLQEFLGTEVFRAMTSDQRVEALRGWVEAQVGWRKVNEPGFDEKAFRGMYPDRGGFWGSVRELGMGLWGALVDQFPEDLARIWRGGEISLKGGDSWADQWIKEQEGDKRAKGISLQQLAEDGLATSLAQGPASIVTSAATGLGGAAVGTAIAPGVGTAAGMLGAGATTLPAFYRLAKDNFIEQVRDMLVTRGAPLSEAQWQEARTALQDEAMEYGLWEAGPEAISQALTAGIFKGAGKLIGNALGREAVEGAARRAILGIAKRYGLEVGEELATETVTAVGQGAIEAKVGLREKAPTVGEAFKEIAGPTIVGAVLQGGAFDVYNRLRNGAESARMAREEAKSHEEFAARWNEAHAGEEGFEPITPKDAPVVRAVAESGFSDDDLAELDNRGSAIERLAVEIQEAEQAGAGEEVLGPLRQQASTVEAEHGEIARRLQARRAEMAEAVKELQGVEKPRVREALTGALKLENGRPLRGAEQAALMSVRSSNGRPYAVKVKGADGKTILKLTPEARADIRSQYPKVARLFRAPAIAQQPKGGDERSERISSGETQGIQTTTEGQGGQTEGQLPTGPKGQEGHAAQGGDDVLKPEAKPPTQGPKAKGEKPSAEKQPVAEPPRGSTAEPTAAAGEVPEQSKPEGEVAAGPVDDAAFKAWRRKEYEAGKRGAELSEDAYRASLSAQPEPSAPAAGGSLERLGEMAGAASENLKESLWQKVQAGDTTEAGAQSAVLQLAKQVRDRGGLKTKAETVSFLERAQAIVDEHRGKPTYQDALKEFLRSELEGLLPAARKLEIVEAGGEVKEGQITRAGAMQVWSVTKVKKDILAEGKHSNGKALTAAERAAMEEEVRIGEETIAAWGGQSPYRQEAQTEGTPLKKAMVEAGKKEEGRQGRATTALTRALMQDRAKKSLEAMGVKVQAGPAERAQNGIALNINEDGTTFIAYNVGRLEATFLHNNPSDEQLKELVDTAIRHEMVHAATVEVVRQRWIAAGRKEPFATFWKREMGEVWNSLEDEQKAKARKLYGDPNATDANLAAEYIRMLDEVEAGKIPSEGVLRRLLREVFEFLERALANRANWSPQLQAAYDGMKAIMDRAEGNKEAEKTNKTAFEPKGVAMAVLDESQAAPFLEYGKTIDPDDLYTEEEGYGLEDEPHVTVFWGFTNPDPAPLRAAIEETGEGRVGLKFGTLSLFENEQYDVLKVNVEGQRLRDLNRELAKQPNEATFPDYKPHLTIAYLKKGLGKKYVEKDQNRFRGTTVQVDKIVLSDKDKNRTVVALEKKAPDTQGIEDGAKKVAQRMENARTTFIENVVEQFGLTPEEAGRALDAYIRLKIVTLDPVGGRYKLNNGQAWDKDVLESAAQSEIDRLKSEPKKSTPQVERPKKRGLMGTEPPPGGWTDADKVPEGMRKLGGQGVTKAPGAPTKEPKGVTKVQPKAPAISDEAGKALDDAFEGLDFPKRDGEKPKLRVAARDPKTRAIMAGKKGDTFKSLGAPAGSELGYIDDQWRFITREDARREGLTLDFPASFEQEALPPAKIGAFVNAAQKLIESGIKTPDAMARVLDERFDGRFRKYSEALWDAFGMVDKGLRGSHDWTAVYGAIDGAENDANVTPTNPTDENPEPSDQPERGEGISNLVEPGIREGEGDTGLGERDTDPNAEVLGEEQRADVEATPPPGDRRTAGAGVGGEGRRGDTGKPSERDAADGGAGTGPEGLVPDGGSGGGSLRGNYHLTDPERIVGGGPKARFARNKRAIELIQELTAENREPTKAELDDLAAYTGWGAFGQELFQGNWNSARPKPDWKEEDAWLREHLGEEGWTSAQRSIINAHYTDPPTVSTIWDMVRAMGFRGGRVLEPAEGIANFYSLMPRDLMERSFLTGIEMDKTTFEIARALHPLVNHRNIPYQNSRTADGFYDLVIGNWPFADITIADRKWGHLKPQLHDFFFLKALDQVREGGLVVGITSAGTMDKKGKSVRLALDANADLVAAFRFPAGTFGQYAGTKVVTDLVILRKRVKGEGRQGPAWMDVKEVETRNGKVTVNEYYVANPRNILGELDYGHGTTTYRPGMIVKMPEDFGKVLKELPNRVPGGAYEARKAADTTRYLTNNTGDRQGAIVYVEDPQKRTGVDPTTDLSLAGGRLVELETREEAQEWIDGKKRKGADKLFTFEIKNTGKAKQPYDVVYKPIEAGRQAPGLYVVRGDQLANLDDLVKFRVSSAKENEKREKEIRALVDLRKTFGRLVDAQRDNRDDQEGIRKDLRTQYNAFRKAYGAVNESKALQYFRKVGDPFYVTLASLEHNTGPKTAPVWDPATILSRPTMRGRPPMGELTIRDAYVVHRNATLDIQPSEIARLSKKTEAEVIADLEGSGAIFKTPVGTWEPAEIYLSGNVRRKLREAEDAKASGVTGLDRNIKELRKVVPRDIPYFNIEAKLGNTWASAEDYKAFVEHLLKPNEQQKKLIDVHYGPQGWVVRDLEGLNGKPEATSQWGVPDYRFHKLITAALQNRTITIRKRVDDALVVDEAASKQANAKADGLREEFSRWIWSDPSRRVRLERAYNETFNAIALPKFDGSFMNFEGMALQRGDGQFELRRHQQNAIWRGVVQRRGLYAHEVGTGKTFTMAGLMVESRRYGRAKKPILFAHNANSATVAAEVNEMYPGARVLYVDNLDPENRDVTIAKIQTDDWDAVVVPHSLIDRFTLKPETLEELTKEEIAALEAAAIEAAEEDNQDLDVAMMDDPEKMKKVRSATAKELVKERERIKEQIEKAAQKARENAVFFEDLGVDMVVVDEAHIFKKPPIATKMKVRGLNTASSARSVNLFFLTEYVNRTNGGGGVHFFTGTPITNTLNEIYNMQRFVMNDVLKRDGVSHWDAWFSNFADSETDAEVTPSGEYEPVTRLSKFVNTAELRRMIGEYMDVVFADDMPEMQPRSIDGKTLLSKDLTPAQKAKLTEGKTKNPIGRPYKRIINVVAEMSEEQKAIRLELARRANYFKNATKKQRKEIMLDGRPESPVIVETDAANAGLDPRLFDPKLPASKTSKVSKAIDNALKIYHEAGDGEIATQVFFMERGFTDQKTKTEKTGAVDERGKAIKIKTKVEGFNLAKEIVRKLVEGGAPEGQIAVVDGAVSKLKRKEIADKMNTGEIRFVIGNTETLGTGVNMQKHLRAMHHLDAPWKPGDLEQRNGRGWRQGNEWNTVEEYRYMTDGIDGRRWQVLVRKDTFIKAFMKADENVRVIEGDEVSLDEGEKISDIAESFAKAAGDPRLIIRAKLQKSVDGLLDRERIHTIGKEQTRYQIRSTRDAIDRDTQKVARLERDQAKYAEGAGGPFAIQIGDRTFTDRAEANDFLIEEVEGWTDKPKKIGRYRGFDLHGGLDWKREPIITVKAEEEINVKPTIQSLDANLRLIAGSAKAVAERIEQNRASIKNLEDSLEQPFGRADELKKKKALLESVTSDLARYPVPAPAWLREGIAVGAPVWVDGKREVVAGHRWGTDDWYVLLEGREPVSYEDLRDENNLPVFEPRKFEAPPRAEEKKTNPPTQSSAGQRGPVNLDFPAHHGTPHKVDRFSLEKIGTGEGAQVYGWGLYFAENPQVAEEYRKTLASQIDNPLSKDDVYTVLQARSDWPDGVPARFAEKIRDKMEDADILPTWPGIEQAFAAWTSYEEAKAAVERIRKKYFFDTEPFIGNTYTVDIDVEQDELLDWDKPMSEQSAKVKALVEKIRAEKPLRQEYFEYTRFATNPISFDEFVSGEERKSGEAFYHELSRRSWGISDNGAKSASYELFKAGIHGIRYLDQGSRNIPPPVSELKASQSITGKWEIEDRNGQIWGYGDTQDAAWTDVRRKEKGQTYNYVIFDESKIKITHENGKPVSVESFALNFPEANALPSNPLEGILRSALKAMPKKQQAVLMGVLKGKTFEQLAAENDMTPQAAETAYREGQGRLRRVREQQANLPALFREVEAEEAPNRTKGRPDLANPAKGRKSRRFIDTVDEVRKLSGAPEKRKEKEVFEEATRRLEKGYKAARADLLKKAESGAVLTDVETVMARRIVSREALRAVRQKDQKTMMDAAMIVDAYRMTGTEAARAFRLRRDFEMTPEERMQEYLGTALLTPDKKRQKALDKADREKDLEAREAILADWVKEIERLKAKLAKLGLDLDNMSDEELQKVLRDRVKAIRVLKTVAAAKADNWDALYEFWISSLLSAPSTHVANIVGNSANMAWDFTIQRMVEAFVNVAVRDPKSAQLGEMAYIARGFVPGLVRASHNALTAWKTEAPVLQHEVTGDFGTAKLEEYADRSAIEGTKGRIIRTPLRFLLMADEFAQSLGGQMQAGAEAYRIAKSEGLKGNELAARIQTLVDDIESEAWQGAVEKAKELSFQQELGEVGKVALIARKKIPGARYVIPFVTTIANIFKTGLRKSPLGSIPLLYRIMRSGLVRLNWGGENWTYTRTQFVPHAAEQLIAWSLFFAIKSLTVPDEDGLPQLTGSTPYSHGERGKRDLAYRTAPPQSIKIGDKWYSYARIEPFATALTAGVDALNSLDKADEMDSTKVVGEAYNHFVTQLKDKTFARGISDVLNAVQDGESSVEWAGNFSVSWVPNIIRASAREQDDVMREQRLWGRGDEWAERLGNRLLYKALPLEANAPPPKVDLWGREIKKDDHGNPAADFLFRLFTPAKAQKEDVHPVDRLIVNWNNQNPAHVYAPVLPPAYWTKTEGGKRQTIYMSDEEYHAFLTIAGKDAEARLAGELLNHETPTPEDIQTVRKTIAKARKEARKAVWGDRAGTPEDQED